MSAMEDVSRYDRDPHQDLGSGSDEPVPASADDDAPLSASGPGRLGAVASRDPETTGAWLHVVSGGTVPALSRAVFELAARFLAAGHRVLLLDGAPKLHLHDRFDRESRWGVIECLRGEYPVLGLVQDSGRLGLYLLAHGTPAGTTDWPAVGRLLEDVRPHFGRAILALDPDAPGAIGESLAGIHLEGWWPQGASEARRAAGIGGRLGIQFTDLNLDSMLVPRLEALDARVWTLLAPPAPAGTPGPPPVDAHEATEGEPSEAAESATLDSDARVRERLRFLLWMRRVEAEGAKPVPTGVAPPDPSEST
jgi:hypothetical protein